MLYVYLADRHGLKWIFQKPARFGNMHKPSLGIVSIIDSKKGMPEPPAMIRSTLAFTTMPLCLGVNGFYFCDDGACASRFRQK